MSWLIDAISAPSGAVVRWYQPWMLIRGESYEYTSCTEWYDAPGSTPKSTIELKSGSTAADGAGAGTPCPPFAGMVPSGFGPSEYSSSAPPSSAVQPSSVRYLERWVVGAAGAQY